VDNSKTDQIKCLQKRKITPRHEFLIVSRVRRLDGFEIHRETPMRGKKRRTEISDQNYFHTTARLSQIFMPCRKSILVRHAKMARLSHFLLSRASTKANERRQTALFGARIDDRRCHGCV
jgi:hypothetical protein